MHIYRMYIHGSLNTLGFAFLLVFFVLYTVGAAQCNIEKGDTGPPGPPGLQGELGQKGE